MKNYKVLKREIEEKVGKLKAEKEQLIATQQQVNNRLGQIAVEILRLGGEAIMLEKIKKEGE